MNSTLNRKIQKVLDIKLDSEDLSSSLEELSTFYQDNSVNARRNLRNDIEKRYLQINIDFLDQFDQLNNKIQELVNDFQDIKKSCNDICTSFDNTKKISSNLIEKEQILFGTLKEVEEKESAIKDFYKKFTLTPEEQHTLAGKEIDQEFYKTLDRLTDILTECKSNLRNNHYQKATLEIIDHISQLQENAYRKLYSWLKEEIKTNLQKESPNVDSIKSMLPIAFKALETRPLLLKHCLDEVADLRGKCISTGFITALTMGGPNGIPRPIEINAHDPLRYLGDMLAWIHQSMASEYELISFLLSKISNNSSHNNNDLSPPPIDPQQPQQIESIEDPILKVLNGTFDVINRPLSIRVEHILQSKPGMIIIYKMVSMLYFYSKITSSITKEKLSKVSLLFDNIKATCLTAFFTHIKDHFDKLERHLTLPNHQDLLPTAEIKDSVHKLSELVATFNSSLMGTQEKEREYTPVFHSFIQKIINLATLSATSSKLPLISMAVFMINSLGLIQQCLESYTFAKSNLELLSGQIEAHMDTLVDEQTSETLSSVGIGPKLSILQYSDPKIPLSQNIGMDRLSLLQSIRQFDSTIESSFGTFSMPNCEKLDSTKLKNFAKKSVSNLIATAYHSLYTAIHDPFNQYDDPSTIFQYKPEQIKTMLDI
ncbi:hypothetical protein CYY_004071 [Polysphondylium violaceum]|uniref:Conserved oligomeric Golgi complex subunit 6 n=1 Tax=Polysphondylium violaceum TaxID=133409 RepID=A0A8J4PVU0_9MYCE|nr:hypothetical protein CYY_004071 [Polysphondylium violaceum]